MCKKMGRDAGSRILDFQISRIESNVKVFFLFLKEMRGSHKLHYRIFEAALAQAS